MISTQLQEECGVTNISLENAELLIREHGLPDCLRMYWDEQDWYCTRADWSEPRQVHIFTGFAWGYVGAGPHGLHELFQLVGLDVSLEEISGWASGGRHIFELKAVSIGQSGQPGVE